MRIPWGKLKPAFARIGKSLARSWLAQRFGGTPRWQMDPTPYIRDAMNSPPRCYICEKPIEGVPPYWISVPHHAGMLPIHGGSCVGRWTNPKGEQPSPQAPNHGPCFICGKDVVHFYPWFTANPDRGGKPLHDGECRRRWDEGDYS